MGKPKEPKAKFTPSAEKTPKKNSDPDSFYSKNPSWRISRIELIDPFGWHILNAEEFMYIQEKLSNFEKMTWKEILIQANKQNHFVSIDRLCSVAQSRLISINQEDIDELVSLRLTGKQRVWGVMNNGTLELLWWDPEHRVCPSILKHT